MSFIDQFSELAGEYSRYRPGYPQALFEYLASLAPDKDLAWDCGTGNGQAALALARFFRRVIATDGSREQIANAFPHPKVDYRVETAESTSIDRGSVDLVTVGTAAHWFDFDHFYAEVRRVCKPRALLAVWGYHLPRTAPGVDCLLERYYRETLDGYWDERLRYLDERYQTLPFPFEELQPPEIDMLVDWDLNMLIGFLASWSATPKFITANGVHPLELVIDELRVAWGVDDRVRRLRFPMHMRVGIISHDDD